jgi:hypothetical protein
MTISLTPEKATHFLESEDKFKQKPTLVNEGEDLSNLVNKLGADTEIIVLSKINLKYFLCSLQMLTE